MSIMLQEPWTVENFLASDDRQEGKHEFDGTSIIPMIGGSRNHQRIISNLLRLLEDRLDTTVFDVIQEMRITMGRKVRYPDISVCAGPVAGHIRTLRDALVTFEVVSDDTEATDRDEKRHDYGLLPSLRHYVILEQSMMSATVLERAGQGSLETILTTGAIALPEIGVDLPLDAIYRSVRFTP